MTLAISGLSDAIKTEIENEFGSAEDQSQIEKYSDAMAKAVINYFKANAVITINVVGGSSSGTHTGTIS